MYDCIYLMYFNKHVEPSMTSCFPIGAHYGVERELFESQCVHIPTSKLFILRSILDI